MYFPFFRGKQNELCALKEVAPRLNSQLIKPIIEPVKANLSALKTCINNVNQIDIIPQVIVNPEVGELSNDDPNYLYQLLLELEDITFIPCVRIYTQNIQLCSEFISLLNSQGRVYSLLIQDADESIISYSETSMFNVIKDVNRYPNDFINRLPNVVVLRASFPAQRRNADYSEIPQFFSDAHLTFRSNLIANQIGFGDYATIDDIWSTSGGPAYVVALHLTYLNNSNNYLYVKHSKSTSNSNRVTDPAGKFVEALRSLIEFSNQTVDIDKNTLGYQGYVSIYNEQRFPGLGIPKKLSAMHHLETISNYLDQTAN
ncbi:sce7725 family protein [Photobacterium phosphoreum]|uniref:sce7725 family protein n=1 Tax=Photobacterium phosphoreum TaxID=659 RepID=UPI000D1692BA|nr:sce7725 family protein [Photobacterium phosphoreum]PTB33066.1 ATP-binding protein [Photobacterium phosphoreum]